MLRLTMVASLLMVAAGVGLLVRDSFARWQRNRRRSVRYAGRWWVQDVIETAALYVVGAAMVMIVLILFVFLQIIFI